LVGFVSYIAAFEAVYPENNLFFGQNGLLQFCLQDFNLNLGF